MDFYVCGVCGYYHKAFTERSCALFTQYTAEGLDAAFGEGVWNEVEWEDEMGIGEPDPGIGADEDDPQVEEKRLADSYYELLMPLVTDAKRHVEGADLAGSPINAYKALREALQATLREVDALDGHIHQWNQDDYCDLCGADGRA